MCYLNEDKSVHRTMMINKYKEALKEFAAYEVGDSDYEEYFLINDRIAVLDGHHCGGNFVSKKCILANQ